MLIIIIIIDNDGNDENYCGSEDNDCDSEDKDDESNFNYDITQPALHILEISILLLILTVCLEECYQNNNNNEDL